MRRFATLSQVSWRQRQGRVCSPARLRFLVGYTLLGSVLGRFAITFLHLLSEDLPAKLAGATFAMNHAI